MFSHSSGCLYLGLLAAIFVFGCKDDGQNVSPDIEEETVSPHNIGELEHRQSYRSDLRVVLRDLQGGQSYSLSLAPLNLELSQTEIGSDDSLDGFDLLKATDLSGSSALEVRFGYSEQQRQWVYEIDSNCEIELHNSTEFWVQLIVCDDQGVFSLKNGGSIIVGPGKIKAIVAK